MASGVPAGRLSIEIVAEVARLQADLDKCKRLVKDASGDIARNARAANDNLGKMGTGMTGVGNTSKLAGHHLANLSFQLNDVAVGFASGQKPMTIFMQQGSQIAQIMAQSGVGVGGMVKQVGGLIGRFAMAHPVMLGFAAAAGLAFAGFSKFKDGLAKPGEIEAYAKSLGMTRKEIEKAGGAAVTWGDLMKGVWTTIAEGLNLGPIFSTIKAWGSAAFSFLLEAAQMGAAGLYASFVGSFNALKILWERFPAIIGNLLGLAANLGISAVEGMINKGIAGINALINMANAAVAAVGLPWKIGTINAVEFGRVAVASAGAAGQAGADMGAAYASAYKQARAGMSGFFSDVGKNTVQATKDRLKAADAENDADRKAKKGAKEKAAALTEVQKAYNSAVDAADKYIDGLKKEIALIGKAAVDRRMYELHSQQALITQTALATGDKAAIANAQRLVVQMGILAAVRDRDVKAQEAQEAAQKKLGKAIEGFLDHLGIMDKLRDELALTGLVDAARERAALALEKETYVAAHGAKAWQEYAAAKGAIIDKNAAIDAEADATRRLLDNLDAIAERAATIADIMRDAFGGIGGVIGDAVQRMADFQAVQADLADQVKHKTLTQAQADSQLATLQAKNTASMIGGVKSLFKEKSTAYKLLGAIEKAHAALEFANMVKSMAMDTTMTGKSLINSALRATAKGIEAIANAIASLPFPLNIAAGAATAAALIGFGVKVTGGGGGGGPVAPPNPEDLQKAQGTGSVLGDVGAKSGSIANSLAIMEKNSNSDLEYSSDMVRSLRAIETGIGALTSQLARQLNLSGGAFDTSGMSLGSSMGKSSLSKLIMAWPGMALLGEIPIIGNLVSGIVKALFGTKKTVSVLDQGITFAGQQVEDIINNGTLVGQLYQDIQTVTKKKFFGITTSTKTSVSTSYTGVDDDMERQVALIIGSMRAGIIDAAGMLGIEGAQATLDAFTVNIGKISLKDLTGEQIQEQLEAVFSKVGDDMANAALPGLAAFQQVGEGIFETLSRLAKDYQTIDIALQSIGKTFGAVGLSSVDARENLIALFGGLDEFASQTGTFREKFLSEAEQMAPVIAAVNAEMARLGQTGITTRDQFKNLVLGLDLSSVAGQDMFASLMAVAPAFAKVDEYLVKLNGTTADTAKTAEQLAAIEKQRRSLEIDLMSALGDSAGALAAKRADDLAAMDETLRALQSQVWAAQDAAKAQADLAAAEQAAAAAAETLAKTRRGLEIELMTALGQSTEALAAQRMDELAALDASLRPLKEQIYLAQDAAAAAQKLAEAQATEAQAARDAADAAAALAQTRRSLEIELMTALGQSTEALAAQRMDELAALDASLRPLKEAIYAAQDAAAAQQALADAQAEAARIADEAAQQAKQLAEEAARYAAEVAAHRANLEIELMRALGNETGALAAQRQLELAALDQSLQGLQQSVWSAQDAAAAQAALAQAQADAAAKAEDLRKTQVDLQAQLFDAMGNSAAATALRRQEELAATDASLRGLKLLIWAYTDQAAAAEKAAEAVSAARDVLSAAYDRESGALKETIKTFGDFGTSLRQFRAGLFAADAGTALSYRQAQVKFLTTSALAQAGDAKGLSDLQGASSAFLEASRTQSSTAIQYQRDVAAVARAVDAAIGAADSAVSTAQAELARLDQMVSGIIQVNATLLSLPEALAEYWRIEGSGADPYGSADPSAAMLAYVPSPDGSGQSQATQATALNLDAIRDEVRSLREQLIPLASSIRDSTDKSADWDERNSRKGYPVRPNNEGEKLQVEFAE